MKNFSWILLLGLSACTSVQAASFDCQKAGSDTEKLICSKGKLSDLDTQLGNAYTDAKQDLTPEEVQRLTRDQIQWLRDVRNRCGDAACLERVYAARINELDPLADMVLTCEEMRRSPHQVFDSDIDLGSGAGSPIEVDYGCKDSLSQRGFMKKILDLAEGIRNESGPQVCTGSIVYSQRRYYDFDLAEAGISPRTMIAVPWNSGSADWKSFAQEDSSGTATYFRRWSELSRFNQAAYAGFVSEFDKAAAQLVTLYVTGHGLPVREARAAAKAALSTVVHRAAGGAPREMRHEESSALLDLLRAGPANPSQVHDALVGAGTADIRRALRVALIHDQQVEVAAVLAAKLAREDLLAEEAGQEPLLSLALGHMPNLEYLLRNQYPVDAENDFGKTALFYAIGMNNHAAVELLLQYGADVHHTYKSARQLRPHDEECAYLELRHTRRSTLMHAAQNSDVRMLKILLESGADPAARDDMGYNAYDYAVMGKSADNARYLASLGLEPAVPGYSATPDPSMREQARRPF